MVMCKLHLPFCIALSNYIAKLICGTFRTVLTRHIQSAVRRCLSRDLSKHAVSEGTKACMKYNGNVHYPMIKASEFNQADAGLTICLRAVRRFMKHHSVLPPPYTATTDV